MGAPFERRRTGDPHGVMRDTRMRLLRWWFVLRQRIRTLLLDELSELEQMAAPTRRRAKGPVEMVPGDPNMQRARSHVHAMVRAMTLMDRRRALGRR
jgi:hypothetical protein